MIWKTILAAVVFIGLCVVGMCFNIIFRRNGKFPETEISRNPEMRKRGIVCAKEEDEALHRKESGSDYRLGATFDCGDCTACELYKVKKQKKEEGI